MGRITPKKVVIAIVTMLMVYIGRETNIYRCMDEGCEVNVALMGLRLSSIVYTLGSVMGVIAHRGQWVTLSFAKTIV